MKEDNTNNNDKKRGLTERNNEENRNCILTETEKEHLALAALGYNNISISKILLFTPENAAETLSAALSKLNAVSRAEAVITAFKKELLGAEYINKIIKKYGLKNISHYKSIINIT